MFCMFGMLITTERQSGVIFFWRGGRGVVNDELKQSNIGLQGHSNMYMWQSNLEDVDWSEITKLLK